MKLLTKLEGAAAIGSFAMIFVCGLLRQLALYAGFELQVVDLTTRCAVLLFFFVFGFSLIGLMLHLFVSLQVSAGNGGEPMIRFLAQNEAGVTFAVWGFLGLGTLVALPFALQDLVGIEMHWPLGSSKGVLVADVGLTLDEVKQRSTLKLKDSPPMRDGSQRVIADVVFEFQIADSKLRFPQSRYYWIETGKSDPHIVTMNVGITPRKMPMPDLEVFEHRIQGQLFAEGWMPGHQVAESEETVRMWSGKRSVGDGRYWARGNTLLIFETNRMDEEKSGEAPGSGEFILYLILDRKSENRKLTFEPSAWPH